MVLAGSFALTTVLARYLNTGFTIAQQVYLRSLTAFLIAVFAFRRRIRWRAAVARADRREWAVVAVRAFLLYSLGTTLFSKAATLTSIAAISFIAALPLVSMLGLLLHRSTATRGRIGWVLGAAAGVAVLSLAGGRGSGGSGGSGTGDLIALVSMLAVAVSYIARAWHRPVDPAVGALTNPEITALLVGLGAVSVAAVSFLRGEGLPHGTVSVRLWAAVVAAGTLNVLNVSLINYAFEHVEPVRAGNLLTLECVWGLFFGLLFFGQVPGVVELAGGALIVLCAVGLNSAPDPVAADGSDP